MHNKKANIPIVILVIGTLVICGLAFVSFNLFSADIKDEFSDLNHMEKMNSKIAKHEFYKDQGLSEKEIKNNLDEEGFYYDQSSFEINETETVTSPKLSLDFSDWSEERLRFSVKYYRE